MINIFELLKNRIFQTREIERYILKNHRINLSEIFEQFSTNPFVLDQYHLIIIQKTEIRITDTSIEKIHYSNNVNDLIQFRNANYKFICITDKSFEINDSIAGSSLLIDNIEESLINDRIYEITNDKDITQHILKDLSKKEIPEINIWKILKSQSVSELKKNINCFPFEDKNFKEQYSNSLKTLEVIEKWFTNNGPKTYIDDNKIKDPETIENYNKIFQRIDELTTFSEDIDNQIFNICSRNTEITQLITRTKWDNNKTSQLKAIINQNKNIYKLSVPFDNTYIPFDNLKFQCDDFEEIDKIIFNDTQLDPVKTIQIPRSEINADINKIKIVNQSNENEYNFISQINDLDHLIYFHNGPKALKLSIAGKPNKEYKTEAVDESYKITLGILLSLDNELNSIQLINNEKYEEFVLFNRRLEEDQIKHYYFEDQITPEHDEIIFYTDNFNVKIKLEFKNLKNKSIDFNNILEKKYLQKLGKRGFYRYNGKPNNLNTLIFNIFTSSSTSTIINIADLNPNIAESMLFEENGLHYYGKIDQSLINHDFRQLPSDNHLLDYYNAKSLVTKHIEQIGIEHINNTDFLGDTEFIKHAKLFITEYHKLIELNVNVNCLETIIIADNQKEGCTQNDIIGLILPITHPVILENLLNYRELLQADGKNDINPIISTASRNTLRNYAFCNHTALYFNCIDIESTLFTIYFKSPIETNNIEFKEKITHLLDSNSISVTKSSSQLSKAEIFKSINEIRNYIPIRNELSILFKSSNSGLPLEKILFDYIDSNLNEVQETITFNIFDTRSDSEINDNIISYINNSQKHKVNWYSIIEPYTLLKFDLMIDINFAQENSNKTELYSSQCNREHIDTLKLSKIFTHSYQKTNTIDKVVFVGEKNKSLRRLTTPFDDRYIINRQIIRENLFDFYNKSKMIATTSDSYNYFSNLDSTEHEPYLYEYNLTKYDHNENSNGNFYLIINESEHYEKKLTQLFRKIYNPISNDAIKYFIQLSNSRGVFQIKNTLSNRNKTQGIIGENLIYLTLFETFSSSKPCVIIPFDIFNERIHSLTKNLTTKDSNNHPDFIFLNFQPNGIVSINFIEVKNYSSNITAAEVSNIYNNQINPTIQAFKDLSTLNKNRLEEITLKLLILDFVDYYISIVEKKTLHHDFFTNVQKFVDNQAQTSEVGSGLLFISNQESRVFHNNTILSDYYSVFEFDVEELIERFYKSFMADNENKTFENILNPKELLAIEKAIFENQKLQQVLHIFENKDKALKINPTSEITLLNDKSALNDNKQIEFSYSPQEEMTPILTAADSGNISTDSETEIDKNFLSKYNVQIEKIVFCLKEFGISIKGYPELTNIGPASVTFKFKPASGVPTSKIEGKIDDLKLILELEHNQEINLYSDKGFINLVVPKKSEDREFFKWEELKIDSDLIVENLILPFGFDNNRNVTSINFSYDNSPHLLIGGQTGSGKSVALTTILKSAVSLYDASRLQLVLVDPKGTELLEFEESPHLQNPIAEGKIGLDSDDAIFFINACIQEMASRYERMKNMRVNNILKFNQKVRKEEQLPWILMVLDEYGELTADKSVRGNLESLLQRLAQKARACGIHLIITTQKPSNEVLSTIIRSNLPAQIALKVRSATDSKIVLSDQTGAEKLYGKGDALFNNGSTISRVQIAQ